MIKNYILSDRNYNPAGAFWIKKINPSGILKSLSFWFSLGAEKTNVRRLKVANFGQIWFDKKCQKKSKSRLTLGEMLYEVNYQINCTNAKRFLCPS